MADNSVEIPNRAAFKASEVCEIAQIPPYVLRSWEKEFPRLGAAARPGGPRIYRRSDIEQILRIKQLVFSEGLTLAGARRRLEGDPPEEEPLPLEAPSRVADDVRAKVTRAKSELRSLLELLSQRSSAPVPTTVASEAGVDTKPPSPTAGSPAEADSMPLLDGVGDAEQKPRKAKRPARDGRKGKEGHGGAPSNVE